MISELRNNCKNTISSYSSFHNFNFSRLVRGTNSTDNDSFINNYGITFEEYAGCMNLSGNELYCYPELAKVLRTLPEYPIVRRDYSVNKNLTGKAFIKYFYKCFNRCYWDFKKAHAVIARQVNNFIYLYSQQRQRPIINSIEEYEIYQGKKIEYITINNIKWYVNNDWNNANKSQTERLDIRNLLLLDLDYKFNVELALINTPFIGIRLKRDHKQKGHIVWYCLDTLKKVTKSDIDAWQKGH